MTINTLQFKKDRQAEAIRAQQVTASDLLVVLCGIALQCAMHSESLLS